MLPLHSLLLYSMLTKTGIKCFSIAADRCLRAIKICPAQLFGEIAGWTRAGLDNSILVCIDIDCKYSIRETHLV